MKNYALLSMLIMMLLFSCIKTEKMPSSLSGLYTESTPMSGEVTLQFLPGNLVVKHEFGSAYYDSFSYYFTVGKINLKPLWSNIYPYAASDFRNLDDTTFLIQNLEPTIPESPETYMEFIKH